MIPILCVRFCLAVFERGHTQSLDLVREQDIFSGSIMFVILDKTRNLFIIINIKRCAPVRC